MAYSTPIRVHNPISSCPTTTHPSQSKFTFEPESPSIYEKAIRKELLPVPGGQFTNLPTFTYSINKPQLDSYSPISHSFHNDQGPRLHPSNIRPDAYKGAISNQILDHRVSSAYGNKASDSTPYQNYRPQSHNDLGSPSTTGPGARNSVKLIDSNAQALSNLVNSRKNEQQITKSSSMFQLSNSTTSHDNYDAKRQSGVENNLTQNDNFMRNLENLTGLLQDPSKSPVLNQLKTNNKFSDDYGSYSHPYEFPNDSSYGSNQITRPRTAVTNNRPTTSVSPYRLNDNIVPQNYDYGGVNRLSTTDTRYSHNNSVQQRGRESVSSGYTYNERGSHIAPNKFPNESIKEEYGEIQSAALPSNQKNSIYQGVEYWSANKNEVKSAQFNYEPRSNSESKNNSYKKSTRIPIDAPSIEKMIRESLNSVYVPQTRNIAIPTKHNQPYLETPMHNNNHHKAHYMNHHNNHRAERKLNYGNVRALNESKQHNDDATRNEINQNLRKAVDKVEASKKSLLNDIFRNGYKGKVQKELRTMDSESSSKQSNPAKAPSQYIQILNAHMSKQSQPVLERPAFVTPSGIKHSQVSQYNINGQYGPESGMKDAKTKKGLYVNTSHRKEENVQIANTFDNRPNHRGEYIDRSTATNQIGTINRSPIKQFKSGYKASIENTSDNSNGPNLARGREIINHREAGVPLQTMSRDSSPLGVGEYSHQTTSKSLQDFSAGFNQQRSLSTEARSNSKDILRSIKDLSANFVKNTKDFFMQKVGNQRTRMKCTCSSSLKSDEDTCPKALRWLFSRYKESELSYLQKTYEKILDSNDIDQRNLKQIKLDIRRTFPECEFFAGSSEGLESLERVLQCYTKFDPKIGYVQGMNFVAASILYHADEYIAFWIMVLVFEKAEMRDVYAQDLPGLAKHAQIVDFLILNNLPHLYSHLCANSIVVEMFCTEWICGLFGSVIPIDKIDLFLDQFITQGWPYFYKFVLALLKNFEKELMEASDMSDIMIVFKSGINNLERNTVLKKKFNWEKIVKSANNVELDSSFIHKLLMTFDSETKRFMLNSKY